MDPWPKYRRKIIKPLEDNREESPGDLGHGYDFLDKIPKGHSMKKIDKLDFPKIKNFCSAKDTDKRMRKQATD